MKKRYDFSWLKGIIKEKRGLYTISVSAAIIGVFFAIAPYFIVGQIVIKLLDGVKNYQVYLNLCLVIMLLWVLRIAFHNLSTLISHKVTFEMLASIRKKLCDKLYALPLGYVKDTPSGSLKNIIVERVDSMETAIYRQSFRTFGNKYLFVCYRLAYGICRFAYDSCRDVCLYGNVQEYG